MITEHKVSWREGGQWNPLTLGGWDSQKAVTLFPREYLTICGDIFLCHDWGLVGTPRHHVGEVRDTAKHATMHRVVPTSPTDNNAEVEKHSQTPKELFLYPGIHGIQM